METQGIFSHENMPTLYVVYPYLGPEIQLQTLMLSEAFATVTREDIKDSPALTCANVPYP